MNIHGAHRVGIAGLAGILLVSSATVAWAAVAAPPSPDVLVNTTNAMLQPSDTSFTPIRHEPWSVGYSIVPGGQDPTPLCVDSKDRGVMLDDSAAIGYRSSTDVNQELYVYASVDAQAQAWAKADAQVASKCRGTYSEDDDTLTVSNGPVASPIGGATGRWILTKRAKGHGTSAYLTVLPVGNAVQLVYVYADSPSVSVSQRNRVNSLTVMLAQRYAASTTTSTTVSQPALLTSAERAMLQPSDVPPALPYTLPADNGWSSFSGYQPGDGPWVCGNSELPSGVATFETGLGSQGGVEAEPGALDQRVEVYSDASAANKAWQRLTKAVRACSYPDASPVSSTKPVHSTASGVSPLTFGGTHGVWSRDFDTYPSPGRQCTNDKGQHIKCSEFSSKAYSIHLLVGRSIQSVTYYKSVDGLHNVRIDQVAVNALAELLAGRWAFTVA